MTPMSGTVETPAQDNSPEETPELMPRPGFRWLPRPGRANPDSLDPEATTTRDHDEHQDDEGAAAKAATGTSIPAFFKQRSASYAKIAGALLQAVGGWANMLSGAEEAFLPDDDDMETIPPPLGRLAARRVKVGDPGNLTDIEDMGMAAIGIIAWAAKGAAAMLEARRERHRAEAGRAVHAEKGEGQ